MRLQSQMPRLNGLWLLSFATMAARIGVARLKSAPARTIKAGDYDPDLHRGDVICQVDRCRCDLIGVQVSNRNVNGEQVSVDAFFRLPSNAEKLGRGHTPSCRYNVDKTVKRLVARSQEIKHFDENAEPLLSEVRARTIEFRLHILMELLPSLRQGWGNAEFDAGSSANRRVGTAYVRSERLRLPYLRMAKAILSFIARVQERPELSSRIRLKYSKLTIPWEEYFFDVGDYRALHDYLALHEQHYRRPGQDRPVALAVEIAGKQPIKTKFGHWQIRGRASLCPLTGTDTFAIRPMLYVADESLACKIASEHHVLVCGVPTLGKFVTPDKPWLKSRADVAVDIISRDQVCRYVPMLADLPN